MPLRRIVIAAVAAATGLVAVADAQYGRVPNVSIRAATNPIVFGSTTTISGSLRRNTANVRITLLSRSYSPRGTFAPVGTTSTNRRGDYRFVVKPGAHTVYRVVTGTLPPARSSDLLVRVRTSVGLRVSRSVVRSGSLVRFTGRVFPRHNGRRAYIQKRSPRGAWGTLARPVLRTFDSTSSRYVRRLRVRRTGIYRVKVIGHNDHSTGFSRLVRVVAR